MKTEVENFFKQHDIQFTLHKHPPIHTVEDGERLDIQHQGITCKNLFLKEKKGARFFLVVIPTTKRMDLKKFAEIVGAKHLSFANAEELMETLGVTPGAVSPLGILNDKEKRASLYMDHEVWNGDPVNCHPNQNDETVEFSGTTFRKMINLMRPEKEIIEL